MRGCTKEHGPRNQFQGLAKCVQISEHIVQLFQCVSVVKQRLCVLLYRGSIRAYRVYCFPKLLPVPPSTIYPLNPRKEMNVECKKQRLDWQFSCEERPKGRWLNLTPAWLSLCRTSFLLKRVKRQTRGGRGGTTCKKGHPVCNQSYKVKKKKKEK